MSDPTRDPGWGGVTGFLRMLVPVIIMRPPSAAGLITLRRVFGSFCVAIVLILVVLLVLDPSTRDAPFGEEVAIALAAFAGASGLVASWWCGRRALDCSSSAALASSYRQRFFLQIAFAEGAALVGFVLVFVAGTISPYVIGLAFAAVGFARAAPTRGRLVGDQARLDASGCSTNLVAALNGSEH
jgi:hypothetical protein